MKKILIMGLPGTGKTTLANELHRLLKEVGHTVSWYNADSIREKFNDWDFSKEGRIRQAQRMRDLAEQSPSDFVICDFVAPLNDMREQFAADFTIWLDTEKSSRFSDTDAVFEAPATVDYRVTVKDAVNEAPLILEKLR